MSAPDTLPPGRPRLDVSRAHADALVAQATQDYAEIIAERDALLAEKVLREAGFYETAQSRTLALVSQENLRLRHAFGQLAIEIHDAAVQFESGDADHGDRLLVEAEAYAMQQAMAGAELLPPEIADLRAERARRLEGGHHAG